MRSLDSVKQEQATIPFQLRSGLTILIEATPRGQASHKVSTAGPPKSIEALEELTKAITEVAGVFSNAVQKVAPTTAALEFGVEFAVEAGRVLALVCQGSAKSNLKVTLTWDRRASGESSH